MHSERSLIVVFIVAPLVLYLPSICGARMGLSLIGEQPIYDDGLTCTVYAKYSVFTSEQLGEPGENVAVQPVSTDGPAEKSCTINAKTSITICKPGDACYFAGMYHDLIFTSVGTGAYHSLEIYSAKTKERIFESGYIGEIVTKTPSILTYYDYDERHSKAKGCSRPGRKMEVEIELNLNTRKTRFTGKRRCGYLE